MRMNIRAIPSLSLSLGKYDKITCNTHLCLFYCKKNPPIISGTLNCINPASNGCACDPQSGSGMQWGHTLPQKMLYLHCGHWAGCSPGGHHSDNTGMARAISWQSRVTRHLRKTQNAVLWEMGARTGGCSRQRPSVVSEPHFIKQGNLLSAYTGVGVEVDLGNSQRA